MPGPAAADHTPTQRPFDFLFTINHLCISSGPLPVSRGIASPSGGWDPAPLQNVSPVPGNPFNSYNAFLGAPRTYGVTLRMLY